MKAVINGITVEGTAEEIYALLQLEQNIQRTAQQRNDTALNVFMTTAQDILHKVQPLEQPLRQIKQAKKEHNKIDMRQFNKGRVDVLLTHRPRPINAPANWGTEWSTSDLEFLRDNYNYLDINELCTKLNRTESAVRSMASDCGYATRKTRRVNDVVKKTRQHSQWTMAEENDLRELYPHRPLSELVAHFGRTPEAIRFKASLMKIPKLVRSPYIKRVVPHLLAEKHYDSGFPVFETIDNSLIILLQDIVKNVIRNKGKISFGMDGQALGLDTVKQWYDFVKEFLGYSYQISRFFSVQNGFRFDGAAIKYE